MLAAGATWAACASVPTPESEGPTPHGVVLAAGSAAKLATWVLASTPTAPLARQRHAMAFDAARGEVILFAGYSASFVVLGDTWRWNGSTWTQAFPASSPSVRNSHALAFDATRGQVVLFGGASSGAYLSDTWTWDGTTWTRALPSASPPGRAGHSMAFDAVRRETILVGGVDAMSTYFADTWRWNGTAWTRAFPPVSPPISYGHTMAFDEARSEMLLFDGAATWRWNGTTWAATSPATSPPARDAHSIEFDPTRGEVVLFGGLSRETFGHSADTWTWNGTTWTRVSTPAPSERSDLAMAFDRLRSETVLFGGFGNGGGVGDTWRFLTLGTPCGAAVACKAPLTCVDGVCCGVGSCGTCETCAGYAPGRCTRITDAEDSDTCALANGRTCDRLGICKTALGTAAANGSDCASGFIADGVCCESACNTACYACREDLSAFGTRSGLCDVARAGTDAHDDCGIEPPSTCGRDGTCDGTGGCRSHVANTPCDAMTCVDDRAVGRVCNGRGVCATSADGVACGSFACREGQGCATTCASQEDCAARSHCDGVSHACVPDVGARCEGETVVGVDGSRTPCAPYRCADAQCKISCSSVVDCTEDALCDFQGRCVASRSEPAASAAGCSTTTLRGAGSTFVFVPVLGALVRRRLRRGQPHAHTRPRLGMAAAVAITLFGCDAGGRDTSVSRESVGVTRAALSTGELSTWSRVSPATAPATRSMHAMAFDGARHETILFGGQDGPDLGDTWRWNGTTWTRALPASSPPARHGHSMAYDEVRAEVVLFGGASGATYWGDTWRWNGVTWTLASPATSPLARTASAMAFDSVRGDIVLFGGNSNFLFGDTWRWNGVTWTRVFPSASPPARSDHAMAFDGARIVLYGGIQGVAALGDTWTWDGLTWVRTASASSPPGRLNSAMAFDFAHREVVLFGGFISDGPRLVEVSDTWRWSRDTSAWTSSAPATSPPARALHAVAYDRDRNETVLFSGTYGVADTWLYVTPGASCGAGVSCRSPYSCVDGVCCNRAACGTCESCNGVSPGECVPVLNRPDPDTCSAANAKSCNAIGECKAALGAAAAAPSDCASGFVADGVCCENACDRGCYACRADLKQSGTRSGVCAAARAGTDVHDDCAEEAIATCGRDGVCDGAGACRLRPEGTPCAAVACVDDRAVGRFCSGGGACSPTVTGASCGYYACTENVGCSTICQSQADCAARSHCDPGSHACVPDEGARCEGDAVLGVDGTRTACAPYRCEGDRCKTECVSVADCVGGALCDFTNRCVAASSESETSAGAESSCSTTKRGASHEGVLAALLLVLRARRRRFVR